MRRSTGTLALISLALTILWLVMLISDITSTGPLDTFEQVSAHARQAGILARLSYLNAALITLVVTMLFAGLYARYRHAAPIPGLTGLVFIPVYCVLNLVVYLTQVTAVPALLAQPGDPVAEALLRLMMQAWAGSPATFFNNLAYALLGIPSILYGVLMYKEAGLLRISGTLLAANGIACILGLAGILLRSSWLSAGSLVGGVFFLLALIPLSWELLRS